VPGWSDRAAVALLIVVAGHLLATDPPSATGALTADRLARVVAAHDLPALMAACEGSPSDQARHGTQQVRRLIRASQAGVYVRVMQGLPVALADPFFRLARATAAARVGLDLFPLAPPGH